MRINPTIRCLDCQCQVSRKSKARCRKCAVKFKEDPQKRFWFHVRKTPTCWIWEGAKNGNFGHGIFRFDSGKNILSHRFSWTIHNGPIPEGMNICHTCDNPPCVNPNHLWAGTTKDNVHDMIKKGRSNPPRGERQGNSKLTEEQVRSIRKEYIPGVTLQADIAKKYNIRYQTVDGICKRKSWRHIGG